MITATCDVCFTTSWVPIRDQEECALIHPHDGEHVRCDYCWLVEKYRNIIKIARIAIEDVWDVATEFDAESSIYGRLGSAVHHLEMALPKENFN